MVTILNRIKDTRNFIGMSQEELAIKVGASRQTINYVENYKRLPSIDLAIKLCKALNRDFFDLFYEFDTSKM